MDIVLSKSTWPIIGWVCQILGWLINGIYFCLEKIGIPNIGIAIILYTIIIYLVLTPLQIKQQKMSKMMSVMQPDLQRIEKKYQNKKDQASQMKKSEETMAVLHQVWRFTNGKLCTAADSDADSACAVPGYLSYSGIYRKCPQCIPGTDNTDDGCIRIF